MQSVDCLFFLGMSGGEMGIIPKNEADRGISRSAWG